MHASGVGGVAERGGGWARIGASLSARGSHVMTILTPTHVWAFLSPQLFLRLPWSSFMFPWYVLQCDLS